MEEENPRLREWRNKFENPVNSIQNNSTIGTTGEKTQHITTQFVNLQQVKYVGFWRRLFAYCIDSLILAFLLFSTHNLLISLPLAILYFAALTSSKLQGTIGKLLIGAIVTDVNGNRISFARSLFRVLGYVLSGIILLFGFLLIAFNGKKQGLHDILSGTVVVNKK